MLRGSGCVPWVLRVLRTWPLTAIEIKRVLQGNYQLPTIYAALRTLRLAGLAEAAGYKQRCLGSGPEKVWRAI